MTEPTCYEVRDFYARANELQCLGFLDESESYEVDLHGIYRDSKLHKFIYMNASGCSCWDGDDGNEYQFDTIDELFEWLERNNSDYFPSLAGLAQLQKEVRANLGHPVVFLC